MHIIDADTHIDETEDTWAYLREEELQFKPTTTYPSHIDPSKPSTRYWIIDGHRRIRFTRDDGLTRTTVESRELLDVPARLRDMDEMGTDVQVILPYVVLNGSDREPRGFDCLAPQLQSVAR